MWHGAACHGRPVWYSVQFLWQMHCSYSQTLPHMHTNPTGPSSPGQQSCCLRCLCCSCLIPPLLMIFFFFIVSLWSCSALCEDSTVISSVSVPRIFWKCVCARRLWSPHFKPFLPSPYHSPDVWWMLPLGAAPPSLLPFCLSLFWAAATPLLQTQSPASFACPQPCLQIISARHFIFYSLFFSRPAPFVFLRFLLLPLSLSPSFLLGFSTLSYAHSVVRGKWRNCNYYPLTTLF